MQKALLEKQVSIDSSAKYLLDECVPLGLREIVLGSCIRSIDLLSCGAPDEAVFEEAKRLGLTIITGDIRFVLWSITKNQDIIYQNSKCERYFIHADSTLIDTKCFYKPVKKKTKYLLMHDMIVVP